MSTPHTEAAAHARTRWILGATTAVVVALTAAHAALDATRPTASAEVAPVRLASARPAVHAPHITFVGASPAAARDVINWAIDRFDEAGLQLPDLEISFPSFCSGKRAVYHSSNGHHGIDFCRYAPRTVLHELAHTWDDTSGAVDRDAFLQLRGLTVWFGGLDTPSDEQGAEHLAEIISWGLMDATNRSVPLIPRNSIPELTAAFELLTNGLAPR